MNFKTYLVVALTLALVGAAGYAAFYAMRSTSVLNSNQPASDEASELSEPTVSVAPTSDKKLVSSSSLPVANSDDVVVTPKPAATPVVVYEAEGSFTQIEKDELRARYIDPYTHYYKDNSDSGVLLTITISPNSNESKDEYPYLFKTIFDSGVNHGIAISILGGSGATPAQKLQSGGHIDWWVPECMMACNFTESFKQKYPEIVAKAGG